MTYRRLRWTTLALVLAAALPASAQAATTTFSSSFEPADPQPTWIDTAERAGGVTGPLRPGIPGNVTDTVVAMKASGENTDGGEVKENLVDGSTDSKWLGFEPTGWVELELAQPVTVVRYALSSANDAPERDPRDWELQGSADGQSWTTLDTRTDQSFGDALRDQGLRLRQHHRLQALPARRHAQQRRRPASSSPSCSSRTARRTRRPRPSCAARSGSGPRGGYNAKSGAGFTGLRALRYAGRHIAERPRVLLQPGLRRRREGQALDAALVP